ncbi:dual specificity protein kinase kns1 [Entophlyctis luteolus]|nr:dual specificity protein kinase kns1 [Entophlyctis luteolus]
MKRYGSYADFAASIHPNTLPQCAADRIPLDSQLPAAAGPNLAVPQNLYWPSDAVPATPDNQQYACLLYNSPDVRKMNSLGGGVGFNSDAEIRCNGNQLAHRPVINVESSNARQQKASKGSSSLKEPSSGGSSLINSPLSASASTSVVHTQPQSAAARAPITTRKAAKVFTVPARVTRSQTRRQFLEAQQKLKQQEEMALKSSSAVVLPPPKSVAEPSQVKEPSTNDIIRQKQQNTLGAPVMDSFQYSASNCALPHSPNSAQQTPLMYSPAGCYYQRTSLRSYPPSAFSLYPLHQPQPQVNLPLPYPHSQQSQQRFQGMEVIDLTGSGSPDVQGDAKRRRLNANDTWASAYNRQLQQSHQQARHQQHLQQLEFQKRQQELLATQKQPTLTKPAISLAECDDKDGHYIVRAGDFLTSRYQIVRLLGQGTFGKVVEAIDCSRSGARVAIKIVRSVQKYREAAKIEVKVLTALKKNDPLNLKRCIHLLSTFEHRNHTCMVFELLAQSIFDFLKENHFNPFPMYHIQAFAKQILDSIAFMHDLRLIHTDLKPDAYDASENLMLESNQCRPSAESTQIRELVDARVRLIDFGSAIFEHDYHSSVVSTRHYRAPEIILGLGWTFPCDMWSIGCILVEFFTGDALFQTHDNIEHLAMMQTVLGPLPAHMIRNCTTVTTNADKTVTKFFKPNGLVNWPGAQTAKASKKFVKGMRSLEQILSPSDEQTRMFCDLVKKLLVYDPTQRITAREALQHPFLTCCL